ncbi:MAG: RDD family protein [Microbacteriaceae bacterium]|nr:RDD family protein [Microbacteriaceae bacterium]
MPGSSTTSNDSAPPSGWPGRRLGLPAVGPRSVGRVGRRTAAIFIDWGLCTLLSVVFFHYDPTATLVIFAIAQIVFLITASGGIGHLIMGLRVVSVDGRWLGPWRPVIRTLLLCLVIPAVIWDRDQRGMHDRLAGTVIVRR